MRTIFVLDNEENIRDIISQYLLREGFKVETFPCLESLMQRLQAVFPDMFILDLMLPDQDILTFYNDISRRSGLPVIFITVPGAGLEGKIYLETNRYEYLIKPFSPRELVSQVRSVFRHSSLPSLPEEIMEIGNLKINPNDRHTISDGKEVMLTPQEYELLLLLVQQPQRTFTRQELLDRIWGCEYVGEERAVDNLVKRLRKKLKENGSSNNVKTIWGCGYRFDE